MKKFISMVMAAAMVVSLVPATAFAANTATFKVVNDKEYTESSASKTATIEGPQIQLKLKDVDTTKGVSDTFDITLDFNNAELNLGVDGQGNANKLAKGTVVGSVDGDGAGAQVVLKEAVENDDDTVKVQVIEADARGTVHDLSDDDIIIIKLGANADGTKGALPLNLTKTSKNTKATVEVSGDFGDSDAMTFATVLDTGIKVTLKTVAEVAEEETTKLEKDLTIKANVGKFVVGQRFELKLNSGFEFTKDCNGKTGTNYSIATTSDEDKIIVTVTGAANGTEVTDEIVISKNHIEIDAADAKVGAVAKITVKALANAENGTEITGTYKATADAVEAVKVVSDTVTLSVDEDDDVPVIYSGVNANNFGITDDSDHKSLEVSLKESTKGSLDVKKAFNLDLPEGVYVTKVDVTNSDGVKVSASSIEQAFKDAYKKGDNEGFEFARKTFTATDDNSVNKEMDLKFELTLIAEPDFEGDVVLKLTGDAFDKDQEVKIAKFVKPYTVEAAQNDMIIDYRNTKVPTNVVVKEAEEGLWAKGLEFNFDIERMQFEDDATIKVDDKSDMELKVLKNKDMSFKVDDESSDTAATVTISDISLYMGRNLAAGAYDLELLTNAGIAMMTGVEDGTDNVEDAALFTADKGADNTNYFAADYRDWDYNKSNEFVAEAFTVKEGFVNIITAGRDQDDASFTKKVVVPVGEKYLIAGEEQVALDVPAYISAAGYTMLPVRAVATALGINNNNVLWNQASRTVTILYGQRIITMVAGQKVVTVNGNTIPASATVQIKDGRTFLPMRDLATALGVTDITWDAATKTATMNGNQNK